MAKNLEFKNSADLWAHYAAARARLWGNSAAKIESPVVPQPNPKRGTICQPVAPPPPQPPPPPAEPGPLTTLAKLRVIAAQHGFVFEQLREQFGRTKAEVAARREIMVFLRSLGWSMHRIAGFLHLDPTSVDYGLRKADEAKWYGDAEADKGAEE